MWRLLKFDFISDAFCRSRLQLLYAFDPATNTTAQVK